MTVIDCFNGKYDFLSNFCDFEHPEHGWTTVEHLFQAAKTNDPEWKQRIMACATPGQAKRMGRKCPMRSDWDSVRKMVMANCIRQKFAPDTWLARKLLSTGDALLVEGNNWGDTFWGVCNGVGQNNLGLLLMQVREELKCQ